MFSLASGFAGGRCIARRQTSRPNASSDLSRKLTSITTALEGRPKHHATYLGDRGRRGLTPDCLMLVVGKQAELPGRGFSRIRQYPCDDAEPLTWRARGALSCTPRH